MTAADDQPISATWRRRFPAVQGWIVAWVMVAIVGGPLPGLPPSSLESSVWGQPPGTPPPDGLLDGADGIGAEAFLFLDETRTPVVMPRMSFEEIERLRRLERGAAAVDERATMTRCQIDGVIRGQRAKLSLRMTVQVAAADDSLAQNEMPLIVDLGMSGFHLLQAAQIADVGGTDIAGAFVRLTPARTARGIGSDRDTLATPTPLASGAAVDGPTASRVPTLDASGSLSAVGLASTYQLVLPARIGDASAATTYDVVMEVSARVRRMDSRTFWLPLELPIVPTRCVITIDPNAGVFAGADPRYTQRDRIGGVEVIGNAREVVRDDASPDGDAVADPTRLRNRYVIETNGGGFSILWKRLPGPKTTARLLDVTTDADLQWDSPLENPVLDARLKIENLRGELDQVRIRLPPEAILLRAPEILDGSGVVTVGPLMTPGGTSVNEETPTDSPWRIRILDPPTPTNGQPLGSDQGMLVDLQYPTEPVLESVPSDVHVRLQFQMPVPNASAVEPWQLELPDVLDAVAGRGNVTIRTDEDHRLRWRPQAGVEALITSPPTGIGVRTQAFRLTRKSPNLPIWLSSKVRQSRLSVQSELYVRPDLLELSMLMTGQGDGIDPKDLRLERGSWTLRTIEAVDAGIEPDVFDDEGVVQWQIDSVDGKWPDKYRITAQWVPDPGQWSASAITLPRLVSVEPTTVIGDVTVNLAAQGGQAWVVDLSESGTVQAITPNEVGGKAGAGQYRLLNVDGPWRIAGAMVASPLTMRISGEAVVEVTPDHWTSRSNWTVHPSLDLQGVLTIRVNQPPRPDAPGESFLPGAPGTSVSSDEPASPLPTRPDPNEIRWTALVNGRPATVRWVGPGQDGAPDWRWEIVSPDLRGEPVSIELTGQHQLLTPSTSPDVATVAPTTLQWFVTLPTPVADQCIVEGGFRLTLPRIFGDADGRLWQAEIGDPRLLRGLMSDLPTDAPVNRFGPRVSSLREMPTFAIELNASPLNDGDDLVRVPRALIRSLISDQTRHDHLVASVQGGQRIQIGLVAGLGSIRVEASFDGQPIAVVREYGGLRLDLPDSSSLAELRAGTDPSRPHHLLDLRVWSDEPSNPWWSSVQPMMRLPTRSGWIYWELVVPSDAHLVWATSSSGRAMRWQRDQLRMSRIPLLSDKELLRWAADPVDQTLAGSSAMPLVANATDPPWIDNAALAVSGNRYLFYASDTHAFAATTISRTMLWLFVGGMVIALSTGLYRMPSWRSPLVAVVLAVGLVGVLAVAPDAVVLVGQLLMVSLVWVAVFFAVAALVTPRPSDRVLRPTSGPIAIGSSRQFSPDLASRRAPRPAASHAENLTATLPATASPDEVPDSPAGIFSAVPERSRGSDSADSPSTQPPSEVAP